MPTLDENGGPAPDQPVDADYETIASEVKAFIAKMQERHGVTAIFVAWDQASPECGGWSIGGSRLSVYAMAKQRVLTEEALWKAKIAMPVTMYNNET